MDIGTTDHLLSTTRAVRRRLDLERPVEREVIVDCIRLAVQAPTGSNQQGWRWIVVTDPEVKSRLADIYRRGAADYLAATQIAPTDDQGRRIRDSANHLMDVIDRVPAHVIPCIKGRPEGLSPAWLAGLYGSILPAVWSFMLALRARDIGSSFTTLHLHFEQEAAELLGVPDDVTQIALLPIGYITGGDLKPARRPPVEKIVHWDGWQGRRG